MGRAPCCEKVGLRRGRWTAEEDEKLNNYIKQNGEGSWRSLPKKAGLLRCGKSCRLRWINYLRTGLKRGNFTREEEETIINLHLSVGNKWSLIASNLPGRTDNEVKNYWNSHLSRKIYSFRSNNNGSTVSTSDLVKMASKCKKKGGRVSRAVAKKYNRHTISKTTSNTTVSSPKIGAISGIQETPAVKNPEAAKERVGLTESTSGVPEFTAAENEAEARNNVVGSIEDSGKNHLNQTDIYYNEDERGSNNSMHDIGCEDPESCPGILMASPENLGGENEVLGPKEGLDDVTLLLERILESEMMDLGEISVDSSQTENESMDPESALINKESDSGLYECFSPINTYFSHDLIAWDTDYADLEFGLWDEGDGVIWPGRFKPEKHS